MEDIKSYLLQTKSAVEKIYEAYYSYYELMKQPERPAFYFWGNIESEENEKEYQKWREENKQILEERAKRDDEFAFEFFARSALCGTILQFAYNGINIFSEYQKIPPKFEGIIKPNTIASKFCIGRLIDDIPIGLIIYAGRNQAMHFEDNGLKEPSKTIFNFLANWYSERFKKWFKNSYFDLKDNNIQHYAENILYKLEWFNYAFYEKDMFSMLNKKAI